MKRFFAAMVIGAALVTGGGALYELPQAQAAVLGGVDMQNACNRQYPGQGRQAVVQDRNNAYSWVCRSAFGHRGGIDVNKQCAAQYGRGAYAGLRNQRDAFSWYCQR